jgi:O-acetylhomoserine (thiol)-lyase
MPPRPFEWGGDIVVHSTTKFLSGHGNSVGGAVIESGRFDWKQNDKFPSLTQSEPAYHGLTFFETFGDFASTLLGPLEQAFLEAAEAVARV